jgi:hypothetical protein
MVVFALYYPGIKDAVQQYAEQLEGKAVVDITNPVDTNTWDRLITSPGTSSAEEVQQLLPERTPAVKAFNTTAAAALLASEVAGQQVDVFIAGDDDDAKRKVSRLVWDGGLRPIDPGPLHRAQQLEHLGLLRIVLQRPDSTIKSTRSAGRSRHRPPPFLGLARASDARSAARARFLGARRPAALSAERLESPPV